MWLSVFLLMDIIANSTMDLSESDSSVSIITESIDCL